MKEADLLFQFGKPGCVSVLFSKKWQVDGILSLLCPWQGECGLPLAC